MMVPFLDLKAAYLELKEGMDAAVDRVLSGGVYVGGEEVEAFESDWADYCGVRNAIGVGNGLDAISLALRALSVGPGDQVIVPSNTYIATWLAVINIGADPIPVEPDPQTHNIDIRLIEDAITPQTKVILPVHLYGRPVDLDPILALAKKYSLYVLEDAAQAHGASYKGKRIGAHGHIVAWSFYPTKNLGAVGDAGAITTDNDELAEKVRLLRNYGSREKYLNEVQGFNSRLDPIQAAILRVKLKKLNDWNMRRIRIAEFYRSELNSVVSESGRPLDFFTLPPSGLDSSTVWHLFVITCQSRNKLFTHLRESGVEVMMHYPICPNRQDAFKGHQSSKLDLPIAQSLSESVISLPIGPHLPLDSAARVVETLKKFHESTR